ncbi:MAG TPA: hypothetical protein GXX75_13380 [Clostridiales bacterium]|nr:hypothetical protein [Clostridiales bacterium]
MKKKTFYLLFFILTSLCMIPQTVKASNTISNTVSTIHNVLYYETEYNDIYSSANYMELNNSYQGNLSSREDVDYYMFTLNNSGRVQLNFVNPPGEQSYTWKVRLLAVNEYGEEKIYDYIETGNKANNNTNTWRLPAGTYYIKIGTSYSYSNTDYKLTVKFSEELSNSFEQEFNDTYMTANLIQTGTRYTGNLSHQEDVDYYKFELPKTGNIVINFVNPSGEQSYTWKISLLSVDEYGEEKVYDYISTGNKANNSFNKWRLPTGTYYVKVKKDYSFSNNDYKLTVNYVQESSDLYEQEFNGNYLAANKVKSGKTYTGNLDSDNDIDYYQFKLDAPGRVTINFINPPNSGSYTWRIELLAIDQYGDETVIDYADLGENVNNTLAKWRLPKGDYYINIRKSYSFSNSDYKLKVTFKKETATAYEQENNDVYKKANTIKLDKKYTGNLNDEKDKDYFKFTIPKKGKYTLEFSNTQLQTNSWYVDICAINKYGEEKKIAEYDFGKSKQNKQVLSLSKGTYYVKIFNEYYFSNKDYKIIIKENK